MFPQTIRSGIGSFFDDGAAHSVEEIVECVLFVLLKECLTNMVKYYAHLGIINDDTPIQVNDFKLFLKLSVMLFADTPDLNQRVNDAIDRYMIIRNNFDEEITNIELEECNIPNEPIVCCNCDMCYTVSNVFMEWERWCPEDGFLILLKMAVNRFDVEACINQL